MACARPPGDVEPWAVRTKKAGPTENGRIPLSEAASGDAQPRSNYVYCFREITPNTRQNRLNRQIDPVLHMPFRASAHQNGASCRSDTPEGLSSPPDSVNARSGRPACCNRVPPARTTANWRFGPSKKRQFPSISATFLTILSVFFHDVAVEGAFWRECDLERFSSNWPRSRRTGTPNACPRIQRRALD
jgi:hypothetical protein